MAARLNLLLIAALSLLPGLASAEPVRGFTRCAADLQLSFPLAGRIAQTLVREGSQVRKGDVLMHLERAAEELDVQRRKVQWQGMADLMIAQARAETYKYGRLEPGMVLTIEPGLYFQLDDLTVPAKYRGIGVRIEDDVVVTAKEAR